MKTTTNQFQWMGLIQRISINPLKKKSILLILAMIFFRLHSIGDPAHSCKLGIHHTDSLQASESFAPTISGLSEIYQGSDVINLLRRRYDPEWGKPYSGNSNWDLDKESNESFIRTQMDDGNQLTLCQIVRDFIHHQWYEDMKIIKDSKIWGIDYSAYMSDMYSDFKSDLEAVKCNTFDTGTPPTFEKLRQLNKDLYSIPLFLKYEKLEHFNAAIEQGEQHSSNNRNANLQVIIKKLVIFKTKILHNSVTKTLKRLYSEEELKEIDPLLSFFKNIYSEEISNYIEQMNFQSIRNNKRLMNKLSKAGKRKRACSLFEGKPGDYDKFDERNKARKEKLRAHYKEGKKLSKCQLIKEFLIEENTELVKSMELKTQESYEVSDLQSDRKFSSRLKAIRCDELEADLETALQLSDQLNEDFKERKEKSSDETKKRIEKRIEDCEDISGEDITEEYYDGLMSPEVLSSNLEDQIKDTRLDRSQIANLFSKEKPEELSTSNSGPASAIMATIIGGSTPGVESEYSDIEKMEFKAAMDLMNEAEHTRLYQRLKSCIKAEMQDIIISYKQNRLAANTAKSLGHEKKTAAGLADLRNDLPELDFLCKEDQDEVIQELKALANEEDFEDNPENFIKEVSIDGIEYFINSFSTSVDNHSDSERESREKPLGSKREFIIDEDIDGNKIVVKTIPLPPDDRCDWKKAKEYCSQLNEKEESKWDLCTMKQLRNIYEKTKTSEYHPNGTYWSSEEHVGSARCFNFDTGKEEMHNKGGKHSIILRRNHLKEEMQNPQMKPNPDFPPD